MPEAGYLWEVIVLLAAAVVAVAFAYHLRLGPIMGYLVAGIAVGPHSLGLIQPSARPFCSAWHRC
jgi:Kef-type K+ transport system membrane component KefB